jgi:uncharacterized protein YggE
VFFKPLNAHIKKAGDMKAVHAIVPLILAFFVAPAAMAAPTGRPGQGIERMIRLSALGSVKARPDAAQIGVGVATEGETAQNAIEQNRSAMTRAVAEITKAGVEEGDIQSVDFMVHPRYQRSKDGTSATISGYRVVNSARITARNLSRLGEILDRVVAAGSSQIDRIELIISDPAKLLDEARKQAIANAKRKAELYAEAAGAQIGEVISIDEQTVSRPNRLVRAAAKDASFGDSPAQAGDDDAQVEVSVVWELQDKKQ